MMDLGFGLGALFSFSVSTSRVCFGFLVDAGDGPDA